MSFGHITVKNKQRIFYFPTSKFTKNEPEWPFRNESSHILLPEAGFNDPEETENSREELYENCDVAFFWPSIFKLQDFPNVLVENRQFLIPQQGTK